MSRILLVAIILLGSSSGFAQQKNVAQIVDRIVSEHLQKEPLPGLSVAVARNGKVVYSHAWGFADLENKVPATTETEFRTASIAKPMTAVTAMVLSTQGKLDLNAPVQRYCPAYPEKQWPINTKEVLGHLAGVRHYPEGDLSEVRSAKHYQSLQDGLKIFSGDPLLHEPETKFLYSTYGFVLAGCVIEGA